MFKNRVKKDVKEFVHLLGQLDFMEFLGVARLFNVSTWELDENDKRIMRPAEDMIDEMIQRFSKQNPIGRYNTLAIMRDAIKAGDDNGPTT